MNQQDQKKTIVISGVNLFVAGPLTILQECLAYLDKATHIHEQYNVIALVHNKKDFKTLTHIHLIEFRKSRKSWLYRVYYEYAHFYSLSRKLTAHLWFSLHDMTPNVVAEKRAVYCHNPAPFYRVNRQERKLDKGFTLFTLFYRYLYAINIRKNDYVVVQQDWIRKEFIKLFHLPFRQIIVAHPDDVDAREKHSVDGEQPTSTITFLYPAMPRVFKNFEVIINAVGLLEKKVAKPFEVIFTITGSENRYAEYIKEKASYFPQIKLVGLQTRDEMNARYSQCSCVLFPSKLETWGLPITEAKSYHKPLLAVELPYARETVGNYDKVSFFAGDDAEKLAELMTGMIENTISFEGNTEQKIEAPFLKNWDQVFQLLLK